MVNVDEKIYHEDISKNQDQDTHFELLLLI